MFTDTHCHLAAPEWGNRQPEIIIKAKKNHVNQYIIPATCYSDWYDVLAWRDHQAVRQVAVGIHPWFIDDYTDDLSEKLSEILVKNPDVWVGEIGLDKIVQNNFNQQIEVFGKQLLLAKKFQRPVIIHNVHAGHFILECIKNTQFYCGGIVHGFSGSLEEAKIFINQGFKIGIGSLLLKQNTKKVFKLAENLPLDSFVLESDSPYLIPNNTPSHVFQIAQKISEIRKITLTDLAEQMEQNLQSFYKKYEK